MITQPREPNESEFDAIVARDLSELADLGSTPASRPQPTPELAGQTVVRPQSQQPVAEPRGLETEMRRDGYRPPAGPDDTHELPVTFTLRHAIKAGFGMTVLAAAVGQTLFFAGFFGGGFVGYGLAVLIAAFAEVTMIGAGDAALRHKVEGNQGWQLLLTVSALVAVGATVLQVAHWSAEQQPVMALTFGAASLLGWIVHITSGLITAAGYLARRAEWDAELDRRRRRREYRDDVEYERQLADRETARQAAQRAHLESTAAEPDRQVKPAKHNTAKHKTGKSQPRKLDRDTAIAWSAANGNPGPTAVRRHFANLGYTVPSVRTLSGWLNQKGNQ